MSKFPGFALGSENRGKPLATKRSSQLGMGHHLHMGGLVAVGFAEPANYLLVISHSGRGVFDTNSWQRVARDYALAYPIDGRAIGIGPIEGQKVAVVELDSEASVVVVSPDRRYELYCQSSGIEVFMKCTE